MPAYQPLTPAVFHVLLALADGDKHGYAIMESVEEHTGGTLKMAAGTLYGTLQRLTEVGWVLEVTPPPEAFRRRYSVEMSLDFADGWREAKVGGGTALVAFAAAALLPVIVVLLFATRMVKRRELPKRRF